MSTRCHTVETSCWRWEETLETSSTTYVVVSYLSASTSVSHFFGQFYIGRELNPSIGSFDIKYFNELRPGLILWVILNIGAACEQARLRGGLAEVTDSMWLVLAFQGWYVADALYNEVRSIVYFLSFGH